MFSAITEHTRLRIAIRLPCTAQKAGSSGSHREIHRPASALVTEPEGGAGMRDVAVTVHFLSPSGLWCPRR